MARYDHLPIYRAAFDLAVHLEQIVRHFDRYHKYTLGTDLRTSSRRILERIIEANESRERRPVLERLRRALCSMKLRLQVFLPAKSANSLENGAPGRTRTCDPRLRSCDVPLQLEPAITYN